MGDSTTEGCCLLLALGLDEHPYEGLRARRTDEDPAPPRELALELRDLTRQRRGDSRPADPNVLLRLREQLQHRGCSRQRAAVERLAEQQRGGQAVTGDVAVERDDVARLLAAEQGTLGAHG